MRASTRDLLCLALLAVAAISLRAPALDAVALNPDESAYEALAAFVVAEGVSEYDRPETIGGGYTIYRVLTEWFGPYPIRPVRLLVLGLDVVSAWLLFFIVARVAGRGGGLAAGLVFQHWSPAFEGYSANREWFSIVPLLAALALAFRLVDRGGRGGIAWGATGLIAGSAVWFKMQAVGMLVVVPVVIAADAIRTREPAIAIRRLAAHIGGGLLAGALYIVPIAGHGVLGAYVEMITVGWSEYVQHGGEATAAPGVLQSLRHLYVTLPSRGLPTLGYGLVIALALERWRNRRSPAGEPDVSGEPVLTVIAFATFALGACWAIRLGGRFFAHYFLFLVPAVAGLFGVLSGRAMAAAGRSGPALVPLVVLAAYALDRLTAWIAAGPMALVRSTWGPLFLVGLVVLVGVLVWVVGRPRERAWSGVAAVTLLELVLLVVPVQLGPRAGSLPFHPRGFGALTEHIVEIAGDDGRLFVWGWLPELYSLTRLQPASHHASLQFVVRDFAPRADFGLDHELAAELVAELERRRPAVIVDAAARSWTLAASDRPYRYDLSRYPEFGLNRLLREDYRVSARLDGCVVYRRRE